MIDKEKLMDKLSDFMGFNGYQGTSYYYCTRSKEAFSYGTMSLDDFHEIDMDFIEELADYIIENTQ